MASRSLGPFARGWSRRQFLQRAGLGGAALMGTGALAEFLAACASGTPTASKNIKAVMSTNVIASNLDPHIAASTNNWVFSQNVYEGLLEYNPGGYTVRPALAESYTKSADGLTYTFKLRKGVTFHDGAKFDSQAVVLNIQRLQGIGQGSARYVVGVNNVVALDDSTVKITLKAPYHYFPHSLHWVQMVSPDALNQHKTTADPWAKTWFATNAAGTGPYLLQTFQLNQKIELSQNKHYWRSWSPDTPISVTVLQVVESTTRMEQLQSGESDFSGSGLAPTDYLAAKQLSNVVLVQHPGVVERNLQLNMSKPPISDPIFRQAMVYAFDYAGYLNYYSGFGKTPNGPIPFTFPGADASLPTPKQDLAKAQALLQQGGYIGKNISLVYISVQGANFGTVAGTLLQGALRQFGINLQTRSLPFPQIPPLLANPANYDIQFANAWPQTADPTSLLNMFYTEAQLTRNIGGANSSWFRNPDVDAKLAQAVQLSDESQIVKIVTEVEDLIVKENPTIYGIVEDLTQPVRKEWKNGVNYDPWMGPGALRFFFTHKGV